MRTHRCRFACFTIAQWEKEAAWLRQQHQKGWQFTHLTAGVFYHFAACPPEDVVYHLEYQDQKDLAAEPLQSLRRRGWAYVDRFTQYFYFRKPAKDISPEEAALLQNPAAQLDTKAYINDKAASSIVKGYQPQCPFDTELIKSEEAVMELYKIGRDELTGADAERDYIRVELFEPVASKENTFKARKFRVAVEVASCAGAGGETIKVTGNLNNVGTFVDGEFNTTTKTFTEAGAAESV